MAHRLQRRSTSTNINRKYTLQSASPTNVEHRYKLDGTLSQEGTYGRVVKGTDRDTGAVRAVKQITIRTENKKYLENEIVILQCLDHPNIVKLYDVFKDLRFVYLATDLCAGGILFDRIGAMILGGESGGDSDRPFNEDSALHYTLQLTSAVCYLHSVGIAHRDIRPEKLSLQTLDEDSTIKLCDFGHAKRLNGKRMKTRLGVPYYVAPEVFSPDGYTEKCDVWSCAVVAYILVCGYPPFVGDNEAEILSSARSGKLAFPSPEWDDTSQRCQDFLQKSLRLDDNKRPTAAACMEHDWLDLSMHQTRMRATIVERGLRSFTQASKSRKVALSMMAQQLREDDIKKLTRTFRLLDENNDGELSLTEIRSGMAKHQFEFPPEIEEIFTEMETSGEEAVEYDKFIASMLECKRFAKMDYLRSAFRAFDVDGDGVISQDDLRQSGGSDDFIADMLKECDANGDGEIDFEEFCTIVA